MRGKARQANYLYKMPLKLGVPSLCCAERLIMRRSLRCTWGTAAMWVTFGLYPNNLTTSAADKRMLNPYLTRCRIYPLMNSVILDVHANAWSPFVMARYRDSSGQASPVCTGISSPTYFRSMGYAECWIASGSAPRVLLCLDTMKAIR